LEQHHHKGASSSSTSHSSSSSSSGHTIDSLAEEVEQIKTSVNIFEKTILAKEDAEEKKN